MPFLEELAACHHKLYGSLGIALPDTFGHLLSVLMKHPDDAKLLADATPALVAYVAFMRSLELYDGPSIPSALETDLARDMNALRTAPRSPLVIDHVGGAGSIAVSSATSDAFKKALAVAKEAVTAMVLETAVETGQNAFSAMFGEHKEAVVQSAQRFAAEKTNAALMSNNVPMVLTALFLSMTAGIILLMRSVIKLRSAKASMRKELTAALAELTARKAANDIEVQKQAKALAIKMAHAAAFTAPPPPVAPALALPTRASSVRVRVRVRFKPKSRIGSVVPP
jgi:hypothetical protein